MEETPWEVGTGRKDVKIVFGYIVNSRSDWTTLDPVPKVHK